MKQSIALAFNALLAVAAAVPLEKRNPYTTTVIEDVTDIVDVYTTVYVSPGDPRLTSQQATVQTPISLTPVVSTSAVQTSTPPQTTSQAPAVVPQQPQQKQEAQVQASAPTSTPIPSVTPQAAAPKVEAVAPAPPPASVQSSAPPAPSPSTPAASPSNSGPSGGSCGTVNGKCSAGDVTTFDGSVGLGACGYIDPDKTPDYVALAVGEFSFCSLTISKRDSVIIEKLTHRRHDGRSIKRWGVKESLLRPPNHDLQQWQNLSRNDHRQMPGLCGKLVPDRISDCRC